MKKSSTKTAPKGSTPPTSTENAGVMYLRPRQAGRQAREAAREYAREAAAETAREAVREAAQEAARVRRALRESWALQLAIAVLWVALLGVQSYFTLIRCQMPDPGTAEPADDTGGGGHRMLEEEQAVQHILFLLNY